MKTAAEFRAEAQRMRMFALGVTDDQVLTEIQAMIDELECRARALGNGNGAAAPLGTFPLIAEKRWGDA
jgi:hypothetical protein